MSPGHDKLMLNGTNVTKFQQASKQSKCQPLHYDVKYIVHIIYLATPSTIITCWNLSHLRSLMFASAPCICTLYGEQCTAFPACLQSWNRLKHLEQRFHSVRLSSDSDVLAPELCRGGHSKARDCKSLSTPSINGKCEVRRAFAFLFRCFAVRPDASLNGALKAEMLL